MPKIKILILLPLIWAQPLNTTPISTKKIHTTANDLISFNPLTELINPALTPGSATPTTFSANNKAVRFNNIQEGQFSHLPKTDFLQECWASKVFKLKNSTSPSFQQYKYLTLCGTTNSTALGESLLFLTQNSPKDPSRTLFSTVTEAKNVSVNVSLWDFTFEEATLRENDLTIMTATEVITKDVEGKNETFYSLVFYSRVGSQNWTNVTITQNNNITKLNPWSHVKFASYDFNLTGLYSMPTRFAFQAGSLCLRGSRSKRDHL